MNVTGVVVSSTVDVLTSRTRTGVSTAGSEKKINVEDLVKNNNFLTSINLTYFVTEFFAGVIKGAEE